MHKKLFIKLPVLLILSILIITGSDKSHLAHAQIQYLDPDPGNNIVQLLKTMSDASENYAAVANGAYPSDFVYLTYTNPAFIIMDYCDETIDNHTITCTNTTSGYTYKASPLTNEDVEYTVTTGGIFDPVMDKLANNIAEGKNRIKRLAAATEHYYRNLETYPASVDEMVKSGYLEENPCRTLGDVFRLRCKNTSTSYEYVIKPTNPLYFGTQAYKITTGYVLVPGGHSSGPVILDMPSDE